MEDNSHIGKKKCLVVKQNYVSVLRASQAVSEQTEGSQKTNP